MSASVYVMMSVFPAAFYVSMLLSIIVVEYKERIRRVSLTARINYK